MKYSNLKRTLVATALLVLTTNCFAIGGYQELIIQDADTASLLLSEPTLWLYNFLKGTGGFLIALISLICGLYSAIVSKSLIGVMLSILVEVVAHFWIDAIFTFFGAVIL